MKLYKPQVQIVRRTNIGAPNEYFLHAVTFCDKSNYRAAGFELDTALVEEGLLTVGLKIFQDVSIPEFNYLTPVVHTIELGPLAFPDDDGIITAEAILSAGTRNLNAAAETDDKNTSTVSSTEADEAGRPIP